MVLRTDHAPDHDSFLRHVHPDARTQELRHALDGALQQITKQMGPIELEVLWHDAGKGSESKGGKRGECREDANARDDEASGTERAQGRVVWGGIGAVRIVSEGGIARRQDVYEK